MPQDLRPRDFPNGKTQKDTRRRREQVELGLVLARPRTLPTRLCPTRFGPSLPRLRPLRPGPARPPTPPRAENKHS